MHKLSAAPTSSLQLVVALCVAHRDLPDLQFCPSLHVKISSLTVSSTQQIRNYGPSHNGFFVICSLHDASG